MNMVNLRRGVCAVVVAFLPAMGQVRADEPPAYALDTSRTTAEVAVGEKGRISLVITPAEGRKVHEQAPLVVSLRPSKGLSLAKTKVGHADVVNKGERAPEIVVEFTATAAGPQITEADLQFFVCTEKVCERQMERVSIKTTVK